MIIANSNSEPSQGIKKSTMTKLAFHPICYKKKSVRTQTGSQKQIGDFEN